ncbi:esterase-like activity of phytase family protein [Pseudanabaena yagii]|uniref:esterase-like activity of phytase family protein n=1 Tax=Pseudanabaena yagii TaxID=2661615 RepID=UPI001B7D0828|nr:esterase-like activity of phytase family protein [Pseudanabaena yagii]
MAASILGSGDVAFLSLIADNPDTFSFVLLKDIEAGTIINVTDNGWLSSGSFRTGEGVLQYVAPTAQTVGTVITYVDGVANTGWTNISGGTNFALSTSGDSLIAFQGDLTGSGSATTSTSPNILAAVTINRSTFDANATNSNTTALPNGLTLGLNAVAVGQATAEFDNSRYTGATTFASAEEARIAINNPSNWTGSDTVTTNFSGSFSIGASSNPTVNLSVSTNTGSEAGTTVITLTGIASSAVTGDQSVTVAVNGLGITTGDYTLSNNVITIANGATTGSVTFTVVDDALVEGTETATLSISNPSSGIALGSTTSLNIAIADNDVVVSPNVRIHDIQGAGHISTYAGQAVTGVAGIVTAIASNGFYLQDPNPDTNDATSEGIFVFTSSAPTVQVGDSLLVNGTVTEFRAGGSANNLTVTEIVSPVITKLSSGNALPAATILGNGGRAIPNQIISNDAASGNVENASTVFDPAQDGIDFYESLEGMLVQVNNPVATSPTAKFGTSEEIWVLADNGTNATSLTSKGGSLITSSDFNPERIQIDDLNNSLVLPDVNVGTQLSSVTGVVNYDFNNYEVLVSTAPTVVKPSTLQKEVTNLTSSATQLTVATFNVENLDPSDTTFNAIASAIVSNMKSPDIINLEEIQDNNGATNDGTVDANVTLQTLINAIASAGGPTYEYRQINPVNNQDGGEPGGNIRVAFLFNPNRVSFVEGSLQRLTDTNLADGDAFASSRKPLVGKFVFNQQEVTVIGNHFNSKGGDQPLFGPNQPPTLNSEVQRNQQAAIVKDYVQGLLATNPKANIVVAGDLNDFEFSNPLSTLESGGLNTLIETLPVNERYTYNFQGNAQALDQILVSNNLSSKLDGFDVVHINSEFADQVSDHDPSVARFNLPSPNQASYTLQLLHYYGESGLLGVETAPIMGALIDKFDDQYSNTLVIGEGDSYIPGPWLVGGSDPSLNAVSGIGSTALGRPDIAIMNAFGTDVSALGNHEFDLGSPVLQSAIAPSGAWTGAQFPLITSNLNFSADGSLRGLADASLGGTATNAFAGKEASTIKGKIAPYTVVTQGGEKIGIVGATTYDLLSKTSPNGTVPKDDGIPSTDDLQEVAAYIQASVDALKALGINKIVMVDQLDTIDRNKALAPLVSGIDVMIAGGGHERLGDANDTAVGFNGHSANFVDTYPIVTAGSDGKPTLIVTTDTEYSYLGRLVVDFNANGEIILPNLNPIINGAYASTEANLQAAYGTTQTAAQIVASSVIGSNVNAITQAINNVIISKDSNIFGYTNVYLEGDRAFGRAQEVNLGDITADANLFKAKAALGNNAILFSLKNGGGLRASIGAIGEDGGKEPPAASSVKPAGAISQLDVENALRFDNKLMVFDTTAQGLLNILNYAAGLAPGNGGYAQLGGIRFSYDPTKPAGSKVQDVAIYDLNGSLVAKVVDNGVILPTAPATISAVVLNFTANGGDGYPIKANADNFRYLLSDGTLSAPISKTLDFTAAANVPTNTLGEQKAFEDFLRTFHGTPQTAYSVADTSASLDQRIQNLSVRQDEVFTNVANYNFSNLPTLGTTTNGQQISLGGFSGLYFQGLADNGNLKFVTNTDRGPNGDPTGAKRPFYLPNFQPEIVSFELNRTTGDITITNRTGLFRPDGTTPLTGLPNLQAGANGTAYTDEIAVDLNGNVLPNDPLGADLEGIAVAANGDYWMVDEYRPAIYHFDVNGKLLDRFIPQGTATAPNPDAPAGSFGTEALPAVYAQRRNNRGFEAIALEGNKLYAFIQSAIDNPDNAGDTTSRNSRNLRILEFDIASKAVTGEYIYLLDSISASGNAKTDKLGDAVSLGNGKFAVVERDDLATSASNKLIYQIDLSAATNIYNANFTFPTGKTAIEQLTSAELASAGINVVSKSLIANAAQYGYTGVEKLEGLALIAPNQLALINDNDFNVAGTATPEKLGILEVSKTLPVSAIDFSGANYTVTEGNGSTTATVRITRTGDVSGTSTVELQLNDGTATGSVIPPTFAQTQGASSSATPYLVPTAAGVSFTSILTVGDSIGGYKMVGIPDGLGSFDNGDGTFTLLMNHELGNTSGIVRANGSKGAFVSKWIINKSDLSVVSGSDLTQNMNIWNGSGYTTYNAANPSPLAAFSRFCSADLAPVSAFYNSATGLGTTERIYLNGEESGVEGRAVGHIATGLNAGTSYELPSLGKFSHENAVASPTASDKTVIGGMDDGTNGQVYFYVGTKTNTGTEIEKAGLTNGKLFGIKVDGLVDEANTTTLAAGNRFSLVDLGSVQNTTGATLDAASEAAGVTSFLRPEDGAWDPSSPRDFYFTTTNSFTGPSRLWRLRFDDPTNPEAGGTVEMVLDGTEGQRMFDNFTIDRYGHILLQEDIGNQAAIGKIWQYDIATDKLTQIAQHDPSRFVSGSANFLTQDEESSGIIDAQDILGAGWFLLDVQAHYSIPGELVEGGQLLAFFNPDTYKASLLDYNNKPITVTFAAGETFKDVQIPIVGDTNPEGNETINLSLKNPSSGTLIGINQPKAVLTIVNDDVNSAPVLTGTPTILTAGKEDTIYKIAAADLLAGFTDANNDVLSVSGLTATNGTLIDNRDRTYSFTPNANFNGTVNLSYNVIDGKGGSVAATQTLAIAAVNDAPVLTAGSLTRKISGNISQPITGISISDIDAGETLNAPVQVTLSAGKGVLTLGTTTGLTGATSGSNITFSGTIANINAALATLSYKGNPNVFGLGADTFNLTVNDLGNTGSGGSLTDSKAIALNIYNTQIGTSGDNTFAATPYPDEFLLGAGNDRVIADIFNLQQNDIFDGGTGSDRLVVFGGNASDNLSLNITDNGANLLTGLAGLSGTTINNFERFDFSNFLGSLNATGSSQADEIFGGFGNDLLDGGAGIDNLKGGLGDDRYVVDNAGDLVTELADEGIDTVQSSINWTLGNNLENLTLTGSAISGTGNGLDNIIIGNNANNILSGGAGNDTLDGGLGADSLTGGTGDDTYIVDNINDTITDSSGIDTVRSSISWTLGNNLENLTLIGNGDINGTGNSLKNAIVGNTGNNILDGGSNADSLVGGAGNDTYIVDNTNDVVTELANEGIDTVLSRVTRTLEANVENLMLTGNSSINGTGNDLNNIIIGNSGNNILDGGIGADSLSGGLGNDTYIVDNLGDSITEALNQGTDLVKSSVSWTLGENLENLTLTGSANIDGTGNSGNNVITGNDGNNTLSGGFGNDSLTGGLGADILVGGFGNDTLFLGLNDGATDRVVYNLGDDSDVVNQFTRGIGGDLLQFNGIAAIDVRTVNGNTQFRLGDGIAGNNNFGSGSLLLTLNGVNGFTSSNINDNILAGSTPTIFQFS